MMKRKSQKKPLLFRLYRFIIIGVSSFLILSYLYQNSSLFYRNNVILPFSLHLNKDELYLVKGEEFRLTVFGVNKRVTYTTTNFRVAGVNFNGRIRAHQIGKAFVIAKVDDQELKCRVYVIDLNRHNLKLKVGDTFRLSIKGSNAYTKWISSNKKVVSINSFGKVKAKKKGRAVIYAKIKGKKMKCTVWVR